MKRHMKRALACLLAAALVLTSFTVPAGPLSGSVKTALAAGDDTVTFSTMKNKDLKRAITVIYNYSKKNGDTEDLAGKDLMDSGYDEYADSTGITDQNISDFTGSFDLSGCKFQDTDISEMRVLKSAVSVDISGLPITSIPDKSFSGCSALKQVTIPSAVTVIGAEAFSTCSALERLATEKTDSEDISVDLSNVTSIGQSAFTGDSRIDQVSFSADEGLKIGSYAFSDCKAIESADLTGIIKGVDLGNQAFDGCTHLTSVKLNDKLDTIQPYVFGEIASGAPEGAVINYPVSLASIQASAFAGAHLSSLDLTGCKKLKSIGNLAFSGVTYYDDADVKLPDDSLDTLEAGAFINSNMTAVNIPDKVVSLDGSYVPGNDSLCYGVFSGCSQLSEVTVDPDNSALERIGVLCFKWCRKLPDTDFLKNAKKLKTIMAQAFLGSGIKSAAIPDTVTSVGRSGEADDIPYTFAYCASLDAVTVGKKVTLLPEGVFAGDEKLRDVTIPDGLQEVSGNAFGRYKYTDEKGRIVYITGMATVTTVGTASDKKEGTVKFPVTLKKLQPESLSYAGFRDVDLSNLGADVMENGVFRQDSSNRETKLSEVKLPASMTELPAETFKYNGGKGKESYSYIGKITFPGTLKSIGENSFESAGLESQDWSDVTSMEEVEKSAFASAVIGSPDSDTSAEAGKSENEQDCGTIVFPGSLKTLDESSFESAKISSFAVPDGLETIGKKAFQRADELASVTAGADSSLKLIDESAFNGCKKLKDLDFLASCNRLAYIGKSAFNGCELVKSVTLPQKGVLTELGESSFSGMKALESVTLPEGLETVGASAFYNDSKLGTVGVGEDEEQGTLKLPHSLVSVGRQAFAGLTEALNTIDLTDNAITDYGERLFAQDGALETAKLQKDMKDIPDGMFYSCGKREVVTDEKAPEQGIIYSGLKNVELPDTLETIGREAFYNCYNYQYTYGEPGKSTDADTEGVVYYDMPPQLKTIGDSAFANCSSISGLRFGAALESIGKNAFSGCSDVRYDKESNKVVQEMDSHSGLRYVSFLNARELSDIGEGAFTKTALKKVDLRENLKLGEIKSQTFCDDTWLDSAYLPTSAVKIGASSFGFTGSNTSSQDKDETELKRDIKGVRSLMVSSRAKLDSTVFQGIDYKKYTPKISLNIVDSDKNLLIPLNLSIDVPFVSSTGGNKIIEADDSTKRLGSYIRLDSEDFGSSSKFVLKGLAKLDLDENDKDANKFTVTNQMVFKVGSKDNIPIPVSQDFIVTVKDVPVTSAVISDVRAGSNVSAIDSTGEGESAQKSCEISSAIAGDDSKKNSFTVSASDLLPEQYTLLPKWKSSDESVVSLDAVDQTGVVNPQKTVSVTAHLLKEGTATISVLDASGNAMDAITVTSVEPVDKAEAEIRSLGGSVSNGQSVQLAPASSDAVTVTPSYKDGTGRTAGIVYESSNKDIVTVDSEGNVKAADKPVSGTAYITVKDASTGRQLFRFSYQVVKESDIKPQIIRSSLDEDPSQTKTLYSGQTNALDLKTGVSVYPENAYTKDVTWTLNDTEGKTAKLSETGDSVTGVSEGNVKLTASVSDDKNTLCRKDYSIKVVNPAGGIEILDDDIHINNGQTWSITAAAAADSEKGYRITPPAEVKDPDWKTSAPVTWSSSDDKVASVKQNGSNVTITGVSQGEAVITASVNTSRDKYTTASVKVIVSSPVTEISLPETSRDMYTGDTVTLSPKVTPEDSTEKILFKSSNEKVATVDEDGTVHAVSQGSAVITVSSEKSGKKVTFSVNVTDKITGISFTDTQINVTTGKDYTVKYTITPQGSKDTVTWSSDNEAAVTVKQSGSSVSVHGVAQGTANLKATAASGYTTSIKVNVSDPATVAPATTAAQATTEAKSESGSQKTTEAPKKSDEKPAAKIIFATNTYSAKTVYLKRGTSVRLGYRLTPEDTTDKVTFSTSKAGVATVDSSGTVSAKKKGTAYITATTTSGQKARIKIKVVKKAKKCKKKGIKIRTKSVKAGSTDKLHYRIKTAKTTDTVTYSTSNSSVATVDQYGYIKGIKKGKVKITIQFSSGAKKSKTIKVR